MPELADLIATELPDLIKIRHDLHRNPELAFNEKRTSGVVQRELTGLGIEHRAGLAKGTGVLGFLPATGQAKQTVALRADMDALPILENTGCSYASETPGKMHACGHDGHTTVLLGAARVLSKLSDRPNNVLFVFQPAEEDGGGGQFMVKDGVLNGSVLGPKADVIFGLHGYTGMTVGGVGTRTGPMMAATDMFKIVVRGRGGHAAMPHTGVDPILMASHLVVALQSISSRNVSPLDSIVVTVAMFHAGTATNIIPDTVELQGTIRTLKADTRVFAEQRLRSITANLTEAFGGSAEIDFINGYPVTVNDAAAADRFRATVENLQPDVEPTMGAEDFSYYGLEIPACFFWLGLVPPGQTSYPNLHAPEFDFNDAAIPVGVKAMCQLALS
ncbi:MAG: amidohydrolase [Fimbriimonadaceae bacterium]